VLIIVDRSYLFICVIILANAFAMLFHVSKGRTCMFFFVVVEEIAYMYAGSPPPHPFWGKKYLCSVRALVSSDSHRETTRKYYKSFPASSTLLSFFYRICSRWHQRCLVGYSCCCPHTTQHFLWAVAAPFPACQARQRCQLAACSGKSDPSHCDRNSKLRAFVSELTMWGSGWYGTRPRPTVGDCLMSGLIPKEYLEQVVRRCNGCGLAGQWPRLWY
jgi:hypothetical protein